jgi:hypothetical protein
MVGWSFFDRNLDCVRHHLTEASHVEDESFFELETSSRGNSLAEREDVHEAAGVVLEAMRGARPNEAVVSKTILQHLKVGSALDDNRRVCVVGHARRSGVQKKLRDERAHDSERNPELA